MLLYLLILILGVPTGFLVARLARDELIDGFNYIKLLFKLSLVLMIIFSFYSEVITLSLGFISIVSYISILKKFDNKWATERKR